MNQASASTRKLMKIALSELQKNRGQEAYNLLHQVLAINPYHVEALYRAGLILHGSGHYANAAEFYQRAIQADASHSESYVKLSQILQAQNRGDEAIALVHHATQVVPNDALLHVQLASLLFYFSRSHEVPAYLAQVLPSFPGHVELQQFYCLSLKFNGRYEEANQAYHALISKHRVPASFRIMYETYLPRLNRSVEEIETMREDFSRSIAGFTAEKPRVELGMLSNHPLFALAYHNRDNKDILRRYTQMLRVLVPELNYVAPHCKAAPVRDAGQPIRVGFISCHMHDHSVGNCYRNVLLALGKEADLSVTFFNLTNVMDDKIRQIMDAGIPMVSLPKNISAAQGVIASHQLDILIYPDIGMDATTHYMAMARLAPYQACFQGHPETTGIDTIDYVISSRAYEPPHADENYTETLLCNDGIDTIFSAPQPPERWLTHEELGLPADKKLYVCPMAIQKIHPDFDLALADILARDPNAVLVLFKDFQQQAASEILERRLLAHCDASRVLFLGWQPLPVLQSILKISDAVLDSFYFGAGTTSQYAFAFGCPIVTMRGHYARGRMVHGYYSVMGIKDAPIADDADTYVARAVKLANDADYKAQLEAQITAQSHLLFAGSPAAPQSAQLIRDIIHQRLDAYRIKR